MPLSIVGENEGKLHSLQLGSTKPAQRKVIITR